MHPGSSAFSCRISHLQSKIISQYQTILMADNEAKARQKLLEAEKKCKGGGGFLGKLFGGNSADEASSLYIQAGNLFKMAQKWKEAGDTFVKAAELAGAQSDAKHDMATHYAEAANCYRKVDTAMAVNCLQKTCDIYTDMGRFTMAAKNHTTIAELYEKDLPDMEKCIQHYQKAADYYKGEESKSSATKCLVQVAKYSAQLEMYTQAIKTFEEIAMFEAEHPTLKYNAKNHFFMALLCQLCIDTMNAQNALKRYEDASPSLSDSREVKFIKDLINVVEEGKEEEFSEIVRNFDKICRLDDWHTKILLKIKKRVAKGGEDDDDDLK